MLKVAAAANAAASERHRMSETAEYHTRSQVAKQEALEASLRFREHEQKVQGQLAVLSHKHVEEINDLENHWEGKVALVQQRCNQQTEIMVEAFENAARISQEVAIVDAHLHKVRLHFVPKIKWNKGHFGMV
jgi:hypothetical protein